MLPSGKRHWQLISPHWEHHSRMFNYAPRGVISDHFSCNSWSWHIHSISHISRGVIYDLEMLSVILGDIYSTSHCGNDSRTFIKQITEGPQNKSLKNLIDHGIE